MVERHYRLHVTSRPITCSRFLQNVWCHWEGGKWEWRLGTSRWTKQWWHEWNWWNWLSRDWNSPKKKEKATLTTFLQFNWFPSQLQLVYVWITLWNSSWKAKEFYRACLFVKTLSCPTAIVVPCHNRSGIVYSEPDVRETLWVCLHTWLHTTSVLSDNCRVMRSYRPSALSGPLSLDCSCTTLRADKLLICHVVRSNHDHAAPLDAFLSLAPSRFFLTLFGSSSHHKLA